MAIFSPEVHAMVWTNHTRSQRYYLQTKLNYCRCFHMIQEETLTNLVGKTWTLGHTIYNATAMSPHELEVCFPPTPPPPHTHTQPVPQHSEFLIFRAKYLRIWICINPVTYVHNEAPII